MKHAFLILAHQDPKMLALLVSMLDKQDNDIYVHIDAKADFDGSELSAENAGLYVLDQRIDAAWGDYSLVEIEFALFEAAYAKGGYEYYHLLSGADIPLVPSEEIHKHCDINPGIEYIGFSQHLYLDEIKDRTGCHLLFPHKLKSRNFFVRLLRNVAKKTELALFPRNKNTNIRKGPQWCSVTHSFVGYLLSQKTWVEKTFKRTFAPDELFIQTVCANSPFITNVYNLEDEFVGCRRFIKWEDGELVPLGLEDIDDMYESGAWFARKISSEQMDLIKAIQERRNS